MALRYNERTGEFEDTNGGSQRPRRRSSGSSGRSSGRSSGGSSGSWTGGGAEGCGEKIGEGLGCLLMLFGLKAIIKIAGCIFR